MKNYNIWYYPIKEREMLEIFKMLKLYSKKENELLDNIFAKYNCYESKKNEIKEALKECILNKNERIFELRYGKCIMNVQQLYHLSFNLKGLSLTEFVKQNDCLKEYIKEMKDIFEFARDKYSFVNELKYQYSSGLYIPADKVIELYNNYIQTEKIKDLVQNYYGESTGIFIEILRYCIKNKTGLLEGCGEEIEEVQVIEQEQIKNNQVEENNQAEKNGQNNIGSQNTNENKVNKKVEKKKLKLFSEFIGLYMVFAIAFEFAYDIIEKWVLKNSENSILKSIIVLIVQIPINIAIWKLIDKSLLKKVIIKKKNIKGLLAKLLVFFVIYLYLITAIRNLGVTNQIEKNIKKETNANIASELMLNRTNLQKNLYDSKKSPYPDDFKKELEVANKYKETRDIYIENMNWMRKVYLFSITISIVGMTIIMYIYTAIKMYKYADDDEKNIE